MNAPLVNGPVQALADRLMAIDWSVEWPDGPDRTRSRLALMREFFRRSDWWAHHAGAARVPFFDVAGRLGTGVAADPDLVRRVQQKMDLSSLQPAARMCKAALDFAALKEQDVELPRLPDPYEPLVYFFERGGAFYRDCSGAFIEIGGAAIPYRAAKAKLVSEPYAPLDHALLDELDA
ncbi:hypothetical protein [Actinomadura sp. 9N407]|uniref:hypothetical protein n=1 Tax=Actinomadura sp. 9N407 TaxID=3375154 RepID=UPI0037A13C62